MYGLSRSRLRPAALLALAMIVSALPAIAQTADQPAPVKSLVIIMTKADDVDDGKIHENVFKALSARLKEGGIQAADFKTSLGPAASKLKDDQIKQMLKFPELIPRTEHVRRNLHADGALLARVVLFGKAGKHLYISVDLSYSDLRTAGETLRVTPLDYRAEMDKDKFYLAVADEIIVRLRREVPGMAVGEPAQAAEVRVICNKSNRQFHSPQSHHLPDPSLSEEMSRSAAVGAGYSPCLICFPEVQKHLNPEGLEAMLGAEVAGFIEYYYRVSNDPSRHARLEKIGRQVLADNGFTKRRYLFTALNSDEINAFAAPAGYIYVTTGMMDAVESDDELAAVIAHEIVHVEKEHGVQQYRRAQRAATIGLLVSILSGTDLSILADFVRELVMRGYDRGYELDADRYGYMYARRTDYKPEAMFTVLGKIYDMELSSNVKVATWMRTHPKADDRVKAVTEYQGQSAAASRYLSDLGALDPGLADAARSDEFRYVERIDDFRKYVDAVKTLP